MKSLRNRLTVVLTFLAVLMISLGFVFMPKTANALLDTSTGFYIEDGARIRLENDGSGIKWTAHLTKAGYEAILAENPGLPLTGIGISIIPSEYAGTNRDAEMRRDYYYDGNLKNIFANGKTEFVYNWAVFYDELLEDLAGYANADELLRKAYDMELVATPFMMLGGELVGDHIENGTRIEGKHFDTARSLKSVALAYYVDGDYPDKAATLLNYIGFNAINVDATNYVSNEYYSNIDGVGVITLDDNIAISNTTKIYYGAKDVTNLYDASTGVVNLTGVNVDITKDGKPNTFLTVLHADGRLQKQYFRGVTLAIDHIDDFRYFSLSKPVTDNIVSPEGEGTFDGYYILTKNIDAKEASGMPVAGMPYNHTFANDSGFSVYARTPAKLIEDVKEGGIFYNKGFTGTFDGQGYTITDLRVGGGGKMGFNKDTQTTQYNYYAGVTAAQTKGGLFGIINHGTVKNVCFNNVSLGVNASGLFADAIVNGGIISNVKYNIHNDLNSFGQCNLIASYIDDSITLEKMFIQFTRYPSMTGDGGGFVNNNDAVSKAALQSVMTDCYYVANIPAEVGPQSQQVWTKDSAEAAYVKQSKEWWKYATMDAEFVDGEPQSTGHTIVYKSWAMDTQIDAKDFYSVKTTNSNGILTGPQEFSAENPYTINLISGLKRFSNLTTLQANKAKNDFSSWDSDIWTVINGQPYFNAERSWTVDPLIDGVALNLTQENLLGQGDVATITIRNGNVNTVENLPKVYVTSGSDCISVVGNKIHAISHGLATILVTFNNKSWTATIKVDKPIETYGKELQFSAHDGLFFDGANVVDVKDIIGDNEVLGVTAYDGTQLTYSDGKILGFKYTDRLWIENAIYIETEDVYYSVDVKIAELIIDDVSDFQYFTIKQAWTRSSYTFTEGDFNWEGYFVLAKNIDATGYTHVMDKVNNGQILDAKWAWDLDYTYSYGNMKKTGKYYHGFRGTFDGQGYTIANLSTDVNGLLGIIAGGKICNLGWVNNQEKGARNVASMAYAIIGGSYISNVFVVTNSNTNHPWTTPFISDWGYTTYNVSNFLLVDNTSWTQHQGYQIDNYGSLTRSSQRYVADVPTFGSSASWQPAWTNAVIISPIPLSTGSTPANVKPIDQNVATMDAQYIDGVKNTNTYTIKIGNSASTTKTATANPVGGVYRYTSMDKFLNFTGNQTSKFIALGTYTLLGGFPVLTSAIEYLNTFDVVPFLNGAVVEDGAEFEVGINETFFADVRAKGVPMGATLTFVSGGELFTVDNNKLTSKGYGTAQIQISYKGQTWNVTVNVVKKAVTYEHDLTLSASEGIFFDANGNVHDVSAFLADKTFMSITDGKSTNITWADGKLLGATNIIQVMKGNSPTNIDYAQIEFETEDTRYIINAKIATLAIDSAWDLQYFTVPSGYTSQGQVNTQFVFADDEFNWNGYYVLVKNIDASAEGYVHDWTGGTGREITEIVDFGGGKSFSIAECIDSYATVGNVEISDKAKKGLIGTFDGQGHTLSNLVTGKSGLFGLIQTGHVINTGFFNNQVKDNNGAFLAFGAANGRDQVKNCFVSSAGGVAGKNYSPLISKIASHVWEVGINTIIIDNTTMPTEPATVKTQIGSYDSNSQRFASSGHHNYYGSGSGDGWHWAAMNAIVVSTKPLVGYIEAGSTEITAFIDAITVDDVKNTGDAAAILQKYNDYKVRRYTSLDTLKTGISKNASLFKVYTDTGWFKLVDGMITWNGAN